MPASTLARKQARHNKTHDLPREPISRDHGRLLARAPSQPQLGPPVGGLHLRQFCTVQRLSPRKQGTRVKDTSQERCCAISTFALVLFLEHSRRFQSKASRNKENQRWSFAFRLRDEQGVTLFASRPSCVMKDVCSAATSRCDPMFTKSAYHGGILKFSLVPVQCCARYSGYGGVQSLYSSTQCSNT